MMRQGGSFLNWMERGFALHRGWSEADRAREARERAETLEQAMVTAQPSGAFGDGRLGNLEDCKKAGLLNSTGLFLGAFGEFGHFLFHNSEESLLTYNRAGGGKGVTLIQPNLAHCNDRTLVIIDVKNGELAYSSHKHRAETLETITIFLNPLGLHGLPNTRLNPFYRLIEVVQSGQVPYGQAEMICEIAMPAPSKPTENDWVREGALELACARAEYLAYFDAHRCTLSELWRFANSSDEEFAMEFSLMATCGIESIERRANSYASIRATAEKQWGAIRSHMASALRNFEPGKPLGDSCAAHDYDLRQAKHKKHTIYVIGAVELMEAMKQWFSMEMAMMTETIAAESGPVRTTFIVDEFANLPRVPSILRSLRLYRGLGVSYWFFAQGRNSLTSQWSKEQVKDIEDQVGIITMKSVWEPDLLKDIELWSGTKTILQGGVSHNGGVIQTANANLSETKRPVLQAGDVIALGPTRQVIRVASMPHLLISDAVPYFTVDPWRDQVRDVRDLHKGLAK